MKTTLLPVFLLLSFASQAQYYFNDIIGTLDMNRMMKNYQAQKVRTVSGTGYDQRGAKASNFSEYQEVRENGKALKISNITGTNKSVMYYRFDADARVISIDDSSTTIESVTNYTYDANGRITQIRNTIRDSANDFTQTEIHQWMYNNAGKPDKMLRIINNTDSLEIRFTSDENGNTGDEKTYRRGVETGVIYYYYDDNGRLTDIVRYNNKAKKLLPDMLFEYDDQDRVIQKITTTTSLNLNYLIWRYVFNEKGLKIKEALFNQEKELNGKIEFSYTFGN
jgi:YD repeat-containing protein